MQFKMVTALFWYAIQNYPGVTALARMIRSVLYMGKNSLDVNGDTDLKLQQKNMA
jgi:cytosine/uracil/thiamine/allantoin permease